MQYHVFISYARKDNQPRRADGKGWVHLFKRRLEAQYKDATGRGLLVYLDEERIENGDHWETSIKDALRQSRILIAVLSPSYLASAICRMELEEYTRHEQTATPGGEGVRPIYFATVPELEGKSLTEGDQDRLIADLNRRNRDSGLNWCAWAEQGVAALLRVEAEDRLADLKANPEPPLDRFVAGIGTLQRKISERLNDVALGELARGQGNLGASHVHFVGRSTEIAEIHRNLINNQAQVVTALHGLGGQGKSALARQYAHAFASYYAAGGRWEVECEGLGAGLSEESEKDPFLLLALAFDRLIERMLIRDPGDDPRYRRLKLTPEQERLPSEDRLQAMLARLRAFAMDGWDDRLAALRAEVGEVHGAWPQVHQPRLLVIFDNVDSPGLLNAEAYAALQSPDWLEMIVTTRLDPSDIGAAGGKASLAVLPVDHLPEADAVALMREMIDRAATSRPLPEVERQALRDLARVLGGFTLAVELAGAYLAAYPKVGVAAYLQRLESEGIATVDTAVTEGSRKGQVAGTVRHREGQVGLVLARTLADLPPEDVDVLHLASHFAPDFVVEDWLQSVATAQHPQLGQDDPGRETPWDATLARLTGRRLLVPSDLPGTLRLHRMVRDHLRHSATAERRERDREIAIRLAGAIGRASEDHATGRRARPAQWESIWPAFAALTTTLLEEGAPDALLLKALGVLADQAQQEGSVVAALPLLLRHLALAESLLALNPDSAEARRDLSVSQSRIGDFYLTRGGPGDAELALRAFEAALESRRQLAADNPEIPQARRDLSVSQERIGDFYLTRGGPGDADLALKAYEAALETDRWLVADNPERAEARRDLSVSQNKIGDVYLTRGGPGDADLALQAFEAALETRRHLAADYPQSAQARRDLSVSQNKIGDFYLRRGGPGDAELALQAFEASLETARQLAADNPKSAQARRDLSVFQGKIGDFYLLRGGLGEAELALRAYETSLEIDRKLAADDPESAEARRDVWVSLVNLGQLALQAKQIVVATKHLAEALDIVESFAAEGRMMDPQMRSARVWLRESFGLPPIEGEG